MSQLYDNESDSGVAGRRAVTIDGVEYIAFKSMKELMFTAQTAE